MTPLTIRQFTPADQEDILALHVEALLSAGAYAGTGPWNEDLPKVEEVYLHKFS